MYLGQIESAEQFARGVEPSVMSFPTAFPQGGAAEGERYMGMARETVEQLKGCAVELRKMGQPNDGVVER